jgi:hypothetical protein
LTDYRATHHDQGIEMATSGRSFKLVIVGGGPAGLSPLLAAHRMGQLETLLSSGVAVVDTAKRLGAGSIGQYAINSDSGGRAFADCLDADRPSELTELQAHPLARQLATAGDGAVALADVGRFLGRVGAAVERMMRRHPASAVLVRHEVTSAQQIPRGWRVKLRDLKTGASRSITTEQLVVASGAHQPVERLATEQVAGRALAERCGTRLLQSGDVLTAGGLERVSCMLSGKMRPRVIIVGGSTSAAAVAHALLNRMPQVVFPAGGLTILHRRPLRIYYSDRQSALTEGYTEWAEEDVCQISGRVFRFAGLRLDSRELIMQARGIGGRPPEPRLHLHRLLKHDDEAGRFIDTADVVIAALGYRPRALLLHDLKGRLIPLLAHTGPQAPMVDGRCRILDAAGAPLPNVFGIGLAAGFVPRGRLGGEASFRGQANGLWLWQHDVGELIVNAVLDAATSTRPEPEVALSAITALLKVELPRSAPVVHG